MFLHLTLGIKEIASVDRVSTRRPACSTSPWLHNSGFLGDRKKIRGWDAERTVMERKGERGHARIGDSGLQGPLSVLNELPLMMVVKRVGVG